MKIYYTLLFICGLLVTTLSSAQSYPSKVRLSDNSIVKDSTGKVYPAAEWKEMLGTGRFTLRAEDPEKENSDFFLLAVSEAEQNRKIDNTPRPAESNFFKTGKGISSFTARDINGNRIQLKSLKGKVVVMNFWFIACMPCQQEMPELNALVTEFADSSEVVFIAVGLDEKKKIEDFIQKKPFNYAIIDDGRFIVGQYGITNYPTHVVLDKEGKVVFHTSGYGATTIRWLRRSISKALGSKN